MLSVNNTKYVPGIENGILDVFIFREKIRVRSLQTLAHMPKPYWQVSSIINAVYFWVMENTGKTNNDHPISIFLYFIPCRVHFLSGKQITCFLYNVHMSCFRTKIGPCLHIPLHCTVKIGISKGWRHAPTG